MRQQLLKAQSWFLHTQNTSIWFTYIHKCINTDSYTIENMYTYITHKYTQSMNIDMVSILVCKHKNMYECKYTKQICAQYIHINLMKQYIVKKTNYVLCKHTHTQLCASESSWLSIARLQLRSLSSLHTQEEHAVSPTQHKQFDIP